MDDNIFTARDIAKTNTFKTDTFRSPYGPLGYVVEGKAFFYRLPARPHTTQSEFDITKSDRLPKVDIVYGYANIDRTAYDAFARAGSEAIINAGTGNANFSDNILSAIADVRKSGVFIVALESASMTTSTSSPGFNWAFSSLARINWSTGDVAQFVFWMAGGRSG